MSVTVKKSYNSPNCRGGSNMQSLRKAAKDCGMYGYTNLRKCDLIETLKKEECLVQSSQYNKNDN